MIPRIIHQTWKTEEIPARFQSFCETWKQLNPGWSYRFWSDRDLLEFVADVYPEFLKVFCSYDKGVLRADAGRYLLLHHFGGVYADIDTECRRSLEPFVEEDRVVLCNEPEAHWGQSTSCRGLPFMLFNGVMASPAGHPFWPHLIGRLVEMKDVSDVLDSTGPHLLTASVLSFEDRDSIRVEEAVLFNPLDSYGNSQFEGDDPRCYSVHHWAGTWWRSSRREGWLNRLRVDFLKIFHQLRSRVTAGEMRSSESFRKEVSR